MISFRAWLLSLIIGSFSNEESVSSSSSPSLEGVVKVSRSLARGFSAGVGWSVSTGTIQEAAWKQRHSLDYYLDLTTIPFCCVCCCSWSFCSSFNVCERSIMIGSGVLPRKLKSHYQITDPAKKLSCFSDVLVLSVMLVCLGRRRSAPKPKSGRPCSSVGPVP